MLLKRLNIMLYSESTGEQIILPINPVNIELKYEKEIETFDVIGFGEVNIMGNRKPLKVKLSHFLPEDDSIFNTNSSIMYQINDSGKILEYGYSSEKAIEILKKWAFEKNIIRLVIDEELNIRCMVSYFSETLRENTSSKPYVLEVIEYRNPQIINNSSLGLYSRGTFLTLPKTILMKKGDTVYSIADKYGIDYKKLAQINNIKDVNEEMTGKILSTIGV